MRHRSSHALPALLLALSAALGAGPSQAADAAAGRQHAKQVCATCHGEDGVARDAPMPTPNIGGESVEYLTKQLKDFRSGERKNEIMSIIAGNLTDEQIADLAAWYSSIKFTVEMPPE